MAEFLLVVSSALRKVAKLVVSEISLQEGVMRDIDFLSKELEEMRAFISYGSEKPDDSPADEVLRNIRDLSYDVEDSLDDFIVNVGQKPGEAPLRGKGFIKKGADLVATRRINKKICDISKLVREASDRGARYKMDRAAPRMGSGDSQVRMMSKEASDLVGMDRPRAELTKLLLMKEELKNDDLESESRLRAVSIVGFGGLGKTTLAKEVFNASKGYFQHTTWVTVSRNPNIQQILSSMLCQVEDPHSSGSKGDGIRDLISRTNKFLAAKRYLIVLNDLWSTEALEILKLALPLNNVGSRVVITTRFRSVAQACCSCWNGHIYNILPLSSIDSWMLFNRRIFGDKHCPPDLVDVAEKILRKCSGVPLILSIVSSLLAYKPSSRPVWEDLLNSFAPIESIESLRKALDVSYHDLPHHLRVCLLYLSIFQEDYTIECDRIVRCWMSEGFVVGNGVTPPEEVGWSYLTELIDRSLIQPVYGTYDGKLEAFQIHDVVLDFIMSMSTKDNFVSIQDKFWYPQEVLAGKFRRLSIRSTNEDNYIPESVAKSPVRSLFIFDRVGMNLSFKHFPLLRVLDLEDCKDLRNQDIMEISKLSHLRFLNLRSTRITHLPCEIGQLPLLKTLDLRDTEVKELPTSIVKLKNLEHLLCSKMRFPEEIGKMTVLSCLSQVDILWSNLSVITQLGNLSQLRELELWWSHGRESNNTEIHENLAISLYRLKKLQSLYIHGDDVLVDLLDHFYHPLTQLQSILLNNSCYLNRIPNWFRVLENLKYICIDIKEVKNEDLLLLSELCSLLHLFLSSRATSTEKLVISGNGFPVLQAFHLHSASADLTFEPQAMQMVDKLVVSSHLLPARICGIEHLRCLKKIVIRTSKVSHEAAYVAIRKAADEHPNHPVVHIVALGDLFHYAPKEGKVEQYLESIEDNETKQAKELDQKSRKGDSQKL